MECTNCGATNKDDATNCWSCGKAFEHANNSGVKPLSPKHQYVNGQPVLDALPPLQLQDLIRGQRSSAIIMAVICTITIFLIPVAIFYIVLALKLNPKVVPSRGLIKAAAIITLPLCFSIIPIIIDIEFWRMNERLVEYELRGRDAFMPDAKYLLDEPRRKRNRAIGLTIALSLLGLILFLIIAAVVSGSVDDTQNSSSIVNSETPEQYISSEHGFSVNFPGFPSTEHSTLDVDGTPVPYTVYSKEINNGGQAYLVQVNQYSATADIDVTGNERGVLDAAINTVIRSEGTTLIESSNNEYIQGYPASASSYTSADDGHTYTIYVLNVIKGNDMYTIMTVDESKESFDAFVNSFVFTT